MKKEDMVSVISQHEDFTAAEFYLLSRGHHCLFIHQYYCELREYVDLRRSIPELIVIIQ